MSKKFKPSVGAQPPREQPRIAAGNDPNKLRSMHPSWKVQLVDLDGPFGWKKAELQDLQNIHARLAGFEQMTWGEIEESRHGGKMSVSDVAKDAQQRLADIGRDEYDVLYKLRITKKGRVWGVRIEHVFHVLWWDPDHLVYPMNIKDN